MQLIVELDHASVASNQQTSFEGLEPSETQGQNAFQRSSLRDSKGNTKRTPFQPGCVTPYSRRRPQTLPRRILQRACPSYLQSTESQPFGLWNPINSSALPGQHPALHADVSILALSSANYAQRLTSELQNHHYNRGLPSGRTSVRHSSLQVEVSFSTTSTISPQYPSPVLYEGGSSKSYEREVIPNKQFSTMSSQPSLHSDDPSKRPPTPAKDLEYGLPNPVAQPTRSQTPSRTSRRASSTKSDLPWNPAHPCYPHPNPHIPLASPLHSTTRIIRIPRDWMMVGDLAPTFSNTYPEILEPWVSEADFRTLIQDINEGLIKAFSPYGWRAWMDAILGVATGWIWEDLGFAGVKQGVKAVDQSLEQWNLQRKNTLDKDEDREIVKAIPLRRTGFLCLDIQIPDPQVGVVEEEGQRNGNTGTNGRVDESVSAVDEQKKM